VTERFGETAGSKRNYRSLTVSFFHAIENNVSEVGRSVTSENTHLSSCQGFHFCDGLSNRRKKTIDSQFSSNHSVVAVYKCDAPKVARPSSLNQSSFPMIDARNYTFALNPKTEATFSGRPI
jgi:hypothetical protein